MTDGNVLKSEGKDSWCNRITMWESKDFNSAFPCLPCFVFFFTPCFPSALRGSLSPSFTLGGRERWKVPEDKMTQRQRKHMKLAGTLQKLGDSKAGKLLLWQLRPGDWPQNSLWSVTWTVSSLFLSFRLKHLTFSFAQKLHLAIKSSCLKEPFSFLANCNVATLVSQCEYLPWTREQECSLTSIQCYETKVTLLRLKL